MPTIWSVNSSVVGVSVAVIHGDRSQSQRIRASKVSGAARTESWSLPTSPLEAGVDVEE